MAVLAYWKHVYHSARDYGWPFGEVKSGEVIHAVQPPEPAFFEKVDGPEGNPIEPVVSVVEAPVVEPVAVVDAVEATPVERQVVETSEAPVE